jgi:hypothetical protein
VDSTGGIGSSEAKYKLKNGLAYTDKFRMDSACEVWSEARNLARNSHDLLHNLGACAESRGGLNAALTLYNQADKKLGKFDENISLALNRVYFAINNQCKLKEALSSK